MSNLAKTLKREPVRVWCYGVAVAALMLLTWYGVVDPGALPLWVALVAAIVVPGTEATRARVTPVGRPHA